MEIKEYYTYLGDNGTITTAVYIPGVNCVKKYFLSTDENHLLTNGKITCSARMVTERELPEWKEIDGQ